MLAELLTEQGKLDWALEEFEAVRTAAPPAPRAEPWRRTSGIHKIRKPRALAVVRALWTARDRLAAERDIAPGRVLPDTAIVDAAQSAPDSAAALAAMPVFRGRAQRRLTNYWFAAVAQATELDPTQLPLSSPPADGPPPVARWADRDPAAAARLAAARTGLAEVSQQWSIPVENLLQPDLLRRLCWSPPDDGDLAGALRKGAARDWQITLLTPVLEAAFAPRRPADPGHRWWWAGAPVDGPAEAADHGGPGPPIDHLRRHPAHDLDPVPVAQPVLAPLLGVQRGRLGVLPFAVGLTHHPVLRQPEVDPSPDGPGIVDEPLLQDRPRAGRPRPATTATPTRASSRRAGRLAGRRAPRSAPPAARAAAAARLATRGRTPGSGGARRRRRPARRAG